MILLEILILIASLVAERKSAVLVRTYSHIGFATGLNGFGHGIHEISGNSKIAHFDLAITGNEDIGGFDVAMDDLQLGLQIM